MSGVRWDCCRVRAGCMALAAGVVALLAGCVSAPVPAASTVPWVPPAEARSGDGAWSAVRAATPAGTNALSLAELVDLALANNPASRKAWAEARAAAAQVEQARGYFLPTVTGTAAASRQRTDADPSSFDQDYLKYGPGLELNYLVLNLGGGRKAAVEQALQTVFAADFAFNQSLQDILLAVETSYYQLTSAQAGIAAAAASVRDARAALDAASERLAQDVGTRVDVLQAQAAYDLARYNQAGAEGLLQIARGLLAQSVGLPADTFLTVSEPPAGLPAPLAADDVRRLIDEALARRPDMAALRATLAAGEAAVTVAGSPLWPSLYLGGEASYDTYETLGGKTFQDDDWSYGGNVSLQWPLFDGLQTRAARRAARERVEALKAELRQAELAASAEVWMRYHAYRTALQKCTFGEAFLKSASAAHTLALDSYRAGLSTVVQLLNAESQLAEARSQLIGAQREAFSALARLAHATGRMEDERPAPAPPSSTNPSRKEREP